MPELLIFGKGYTARAFARRLGPEWHVVGTRRTGGSVPTDSDGAVEFSREHPLPLALFRGVTHILVSIPPDEVGDPVFDRHSGEIGAMRDLRWLGYLSTTGVYGSRDGGWVDERSELTPTSARAQRRVAAEAAWLTQYRRYGIPVHIFRLAGIYGPGRSAFDALRDGTAKLINSGDQVFSRIHVDDAATVLLASIAKPRPGAIYNVCDDEPAAQADVVGHAAQLLGIEAPPLVPLAEAGLSPMARSFYADNKRVSNALVKRELGAILAYPNYRAGLAAILAAGG